MSTAVFLPLVDTIHLGSQREELSSAELDAQLNELSLNLSDVNLSEVAENAVNAFFSGFDLEQLASEAEKIKASHSVLEKNDRGMIISEFIEKEGLYVKQLHCLMENYVIPLKKNNVIGSDFDLLFSGIEDLTDLIETLVNTLRTQLENNEEDVSIAKLFLDQWPRLKSILELRFSNFLDVMSAINTLTTSSNKFKEIVDTSPVFPSLPLLAIAPIKSFTRYRLLFSSLYQPTNEDDDDYDDLGKIIRLLSIFHERLKLISIEKSFVDFDVHLTLRDTDPEGTHLRKLLMEAPYMVYKGNSKFETFLFMFDDVLVMTTRDSSVTNALAYKFREGFEFDKIWTYWGKNEKNILTVGQPGTELKFYSIDDGVRVGKWYNTLKELETKAKQSKDDYKGKLELHVDNLNEVVVPPQTVELTTLVSTEELRSSALPSFGIQPNRFIKYALFEVVNEVERQLAPYECPLMLARHYTKKNYKFQFTFRFIIEAYQTIEGAAGSPGSMTSRSSGRIDKIKKFGGINMSFSFSKGKKDTTQVMDELLKEKKNLFFGLNYNEFVDRCIEDLMEEDKAPDMETFIPSTLEDMLFVLYKHGPHTLGIFRKSAHRATVQTVQETLNAGKDYDILSLRAAEVASLTKAFFRMLPECIFTESLYPEFLEVATIEDEADKETKLLSLLSSLPPPNCRLITVFIQVLLAVSLRSENNNMTIDNLAICVGPSLLFDSTKDVHDPNEFTAVHNVVGFLISHCGPLFGSEKIERFEEILAQSSSEAESASSSRKSSEGSVATIDSASQSVSPSPSPSPKLMSVQTSPAATTTAPTNGLLNDIKKNIGQSESAPVSSTDQATDIDSLPAIE